MTYLYRSYMVQLSCQVLFYIVRSRPLVCPRQLHENDVVSLCMMMSSPHDHAETMENTNHNAVTSSGMTALR